MPLLRGNLTDRPDWCELEFFSIERLNPGRPWTWQAVHSANKLVVVEGTCRIGADRLSRGGTVDRPAGEQLVEPEVPAVVVVLGGRWGAECGGAGVFMVDRSDPSDDLGDRVSYSKHTRFDAHYHDCDEYWILVEGRGTAVSEGVSYTVGPGDCIATRMGHHHDFPLVDDPVQAVYFETTMRGEKRRGHLWEHTHGPATGSGA